MTSNEGLPTEPEPPQNLIARIDAKQRRLPGISFLTAVWKKYGDDGGGKLVAQLTYSAFLSLFPMLLVLTTVLGYVLSGHPDLQRQILDSAFVQFPVIGDQLRTNVTSLNGSAVALAIGLVAALWGGLGAAQTSQDVLSTVWMVPHRRRPGFLPRLAKSGLVILVMLAGLLTTSAAAAVASQLTAIDLIGRILIVVVATGFNVVWFGLAFRILMPVRVSWSETLPGSVVAAVGVQVLLLVGAVLVNRQLRGASQSYGLFGIVLGLLGWLTLVATVLVLAAEVNAVRAHGLWPRSLVTPGLTDEDRRALVRTAEVEERAPDERVDVSFGHRAEH